MIRELSKDVTLESVRSDSFVWGRFVTFDLLLDDVESMILVVGLRLIRGDISGLCLESGTIGEGNIST